ncbi:SMP-30/gluconolactonase/LRE family protein [Rhodanobacter caeni]|uniref:SMP-30/Gluconolactonase/LRE-like region domain-containing protein n=1 Tax=Rhodanobacter caeni TaxID=657654 RepID=A0ABP3DUQ6_9GAMM
MIRAVCFALALLATAASSAAEIVVHDGGSQPESMAVGPDGTLYVGSASTPYVYTVKKGHTTATRFIDASAAGPGTFFFGVLADAATHTLWTCQLTPVAGATPVRRSTALRGFDLKSGAPKLSWTLPGDNSTCNDFAVGPDKALYITDTANQKIYRLAPGTQVPKLYLDHRSLLGIDGIAFLDGTLYVNNVFFNKLYRVPVGADGKPGTPVDIWMDAPVHGPDGMRAANGKLFVAANGSGEISSLTINGNTAHVTVIKDGLKTPTGVEPAGDTLWFTERATGKVWSVPMPE